MVYAIVCVAGMAVGLYAGKKRQLGSGWCEIAKDMCADIADASVSAWIKVSGPFRKGNTESKDLAGEGVEVVDA